MAITLESVTKILVQRADCEFMRWFVQREEFISTIQKVLNETNDPQIVEGEVEKQIRSVFTNSDEMYENSLYCPDNEVTGNLFG